MRWSAPLGKIAGIRIYVHATFFLLVALIAVADSQPGGRGLVDGLLWLVLIFACVVVHELAHSLVARSKGAVVQSIVLLPIGGVSLMEKMPEYWADELMVALVGPLASFGLAIAAGAATLVSGGHLLPINIYSGALLPRLVWLNLLLGGFNLLPGFPLDGGRVVRAALERRRDLVSATRIAAQMGRTIGAVLVVAGIFWDFWLVLIGVFVFLGASQEERATAVHFRLRGVRVRDFMRTPVATLDAGAPLAAAATGWLGPHIVTSDGRYYGIVNGTELARAAARAQWGEGGVVADLTDREAPYLDADDDIGRSALDKLLASGYTALPVVQDGRVLGVLVIDDIAAWLDSRNVTR